MLKHRATLIAALALAAAGCGQSNASIEARRPTPQAAAPQQAPQGDPTCGGECPTATPADAAPSVDIYEPKTGAHISKKTLSIRGTAQDDQPGLAVMVSIDGSTWLAAAVENGTFAAEVPLPDLDGDYVTVHAQATDSAGHVLLAVQSVRVDNVGPKLTVDPITAPNLAAWISGISITGGADDGSGALTVRAEVDGNGYVPLTLAGGRWQQPFTASLGEDYVAHTIALEATDGFGNITRAQQTFFVDLMPPRISIAMPSQGSRLNALDVGASGTVRVSFSMSDGDPKAYAREPGKTTPITFLEVQTRPTDDGVVYEVKVEAVDSSGNKDDDVVEFYVDRVAPTVIYLAPANGEISDAHDVAVGFSEAMKATGPAVVSSPATLSGTWLNGDTGFSASLPSADTSYTFSLQPLTDKAGNPLAVAPSWSAVIKPLLPPDGAVIANLVTRFSAATDEDGALTVVAAHGPYAETIRTNTMTGGFLRSPAVQVYPGTPVHAVAHRTQAGGAAERIAGAKVFNTSNFARVFWWRGADEQTAPTMAEALIPTPAIDGEGTNLGRVGYIRSGLYERAGRTSVAVSVRPDRIAAVDGRWEAVQVDVNGFSRETYSCVRPFAGGQALCGMSGSRTWNEFGSNPRYSHAITRSCSYHVFTDTNGMRPIVIEPFVTNCRLLSCPVDLRWVDSTHVDLEVATATADTMVAARRTPQGIQVFDLVPRANCEPDFLNGQLIPQSVNAVQFQPVRIAGRPALVWLDSGGALRLSRP